MLSVLSVSHLLKQFITYLLLVLLLLTSGEMLDNGFNHSVFITQCLPNTLTNLHSLRKDLMVQKQMDQRLKKLAKNVHSGTKIKSLRGGSVEVVVPNKVKWPNEYVLSGIKKESIQHDQISLLQWVTGYCRILKEEKDLQIREHRLDYLISLMEDAQDFSWDAARASHAVLLCRMEQGEVSDYSQTEKLDRIRRANAQRHIVASPVEKQLEKKVKNCNLQLF